MTALNPMQLGMAGLGRVEPAIVRRPTRDRRAPA